jgi:cytochrome c oxidase subunit 2
MTTQVSTRGHSGEPRHGLRIAIAWAVASAIAVPLVYYVLGPHMPPGTLSDQSRGQSWDLQVMTALCTPVFLFVVIYGIYALTFFRAPRGETTIVDGPPLRGNVKLQATWILATTAIVMYLFGFGTYELITPAGAGGGEGPSPIWRPAASTSSMLQVQVIGQQWRFTYRWPQYGGIETTGIELPVNREVQVNVTSLDVIHSWWAYQLGVKADANPGVNNVAYVKPLMLGHFVVRCGELCGIWHGAMFNDGNVVTASQFNSWISAQMARDKPIMPYLPRVQRTYVPDECGGSGGNYPGSDSVNLPSPAPVDCGK